jgi:hypothetical protein
VDECWRGAVVFDLPFLPGAGMGAGAGEGGVGVEALMEDGEGGVEDSVGQVGERDGDGRATAVVVTGAIFFAGIL